MSKQNQIKVKNEALESLVLDEMFDYLVTADPQFEEMCQGQFTTGSNCLRRLGSVLWNSTSRYSLGYDGVICFGYDFSKDDKLKEVYISGRIYSNPRVVRSGQKGNLGFYIVEKSELPPAA